MVIISSTPKTSPEPSPSLSTSASSFNVREIKDPSQHCQIVLAHQNRQWSFQVSLETKALLLPHIDKFGKLLSRNRTDADDNAAIEEFSDIMLASAFLGYLLKTDIQQSAVGIVHQAFEESFLAGTDIHAYATELDAFTRDSLLRTYYTALKVTNSPGRPATSALFKASQKGEAQLFAIFGGQGSVNTSCLKELSDLYSIYGALLEDLIDLATHTLRGLVSLPRVAAYFENFGFDIKRWLEVPETAPHQAYLTSAPVSFPIIGLLSLSHYCITCKILGKSPGEVRDTLQGVTGHSQGIITAAAVARSGSWEAFYDSAQLAIEILFWVGFESQHGAPASSLSSTAVKDSMEAGEGRPSPMLAIHGLEQKRLEEILQETNRHVLEKDQVYLALINSQDNIVVAGPSKSLRGFSLQLRKLKAIEGLDQSRVLFNVRRPMVQHQYLPISAPFHTPHLKGVTKRVLDALQPLSFSGDDLGIALHHTGTGEDCRQYGPSDLIEPLVRMMTDEQVDWPKATRFPHASHVLDFGPGRVGSLIHQRTEGTGVRVIIVSDLSSFLRGIGSKQELFASTMPLSAPNWGELYRPRLIRDSTGKAKLDTKMSRLFGAPPVMVAGMTPTTVPWDFVAAVSKAGYHVELAGGGYSNASEFKAAVLKVAENAPRCGITCNVIYANPKAIAWQIPLIRQLIRSGVPIDGLTIGAGVPSTDVAKDYIETMGLKHISFKPGSQEAILHVISIAQACPHFAICLQWTGGRGGGHHSFEDFHTPILKTYGQIRQCDNIVLVAGSGFGGARDTYPYLTGQWSRSLGYPLMPFDGVLLGSRMMITKEAHTSPKAKHLIAEAEGVADLEWHRTYQAATGGIVTVKSEMGEPIHKLANRGVTLWKELDEKVFSIKDQSRRLEELSKMRGQVIDRLNNDFQKPWFAVNSAGENVEIDDMTYLEVLQRLVFLMYVHHQGRWVDPSYEMLVLDFTTRVRERLVPVSPFKTRRITDPRNFLLDFQRSYPTTAAELIHPEDVSFFIGGCKRNGQKPVNFIPRLDSSFEHWFKKDSLWQAEDIDAVVYQDAQRACIIHGPVAARHSRVVDEPAATVLDTIARSHIDMLSREFYSDDDAAMSTKLRKDNMPTVQLHLDNVFVQELGMRKAYRISTSGPLPETDSFLRLLCQDTIGWAQACFADKSIYQGSGRQLNPIRSAFAPHHLHTVTINYSIGKEVACISLSALDAALDITREILRIDCSDGKRVTLTLFRSDPCATNDVALQFCFNYTPGGQFCRLDEDMDHRNRKIKVFYAHLWLGHYPGDLISATLSTEFDGGRVTISPKMVQQFMTVIGNSDKDQSMQESADVYVPLDFCVVVAWDALVKPLLSSAIDGDLLQLLHQSNHFEYYPGVKPLQLGESVQTSSRIQAVTIEASGKAVEIAAEIRRRMEPVVKVVSTFLLRGSFSDHESTFRCTREQDTKITVTSQKSQALLLSREWLRLDNPTASLIGRTIVFKLDTHVTYGRKSTFAGLRTAGQVYDITNTGTSEKIGNVFFEAGSCYGNPVMDFLSRHGSPLCLSRPLQNPGWNGDSSWIIQVPTRNSAYARVSKDTNPIHVCPVFAMYAYLPGTVTHGMYTSAAVRRVIEKSVAEGDTKRFRQYFASFVGMVLPGDVLRVEMQHVAMRDGSLVVEIQAYNDSTGDKVLEAEAEVEQAPTAYLFTGQGSQEKGMGMALYNTSPAARDIWDRGDRYLLDLYGFSIIDIVRDDPKTLTVHFGGARGRKIRENYLAMNKEVSSSDNRTGKEQIMKTLTPSSGFYTFHDERGLLYSTQFAQPALTLMEMATFEDLKSKGLVQKGAMFAGHSLGEYSALGCLSSFMPMESLLSLVFYRGLTMQLAMERDEQGRTDFSMLAVNPSRVGKDFKQETFEVLVNLIAQESRVLLEVVNYNVEGQQYVCAGHLQALWILTQMLDHLHHHPHTGTKPDILLQLVCQQISASPTLSAHVQLKRSTSAIPLKGVDIPFHSTYLKGGIDAYRTFLEGKILEDSIDPDKLVDTFVPNVIGKPFSVDKMYVAEVAKVTRSATLNRMLETWTEV